MIDQADQARWILRDMERDAKEHIELEREVRRIEIIPVGFIFTASLGFLLYRMAIEFYDIQVITPSIAVGVCAPMIINYIGLRKQQKRLTDRWEKEGYNLDKVIQKMR